MQKLLSNTRIWQEDTTCSSGELSCAVLPTSPVSSPKFLVEEKNLLQYRKRLHGKVLYMTCEETCYRLTDGWCGEVTELKSTHEEADTRLLLHASDDANMGSKAFIITAEDTDVMVLCLAFQKDITCPIFMKCGTQNRTRYVNISKLAS